MPLINPNNMTAIVKYQGAATAAVQNIMKCVVVEKSEENYIILHCCCGSTMTKICMRILYKMNLYMSSMQFHEMM
eukprot:15336819-Ditylum_brightwellii.AAC.1